MDLIEFQLGATFVLKLIIIIITKLMQQTQGRETSLHLEQSPPEEKNQQKQLNEFVNIQQFARSALQVQQPQTTGLKNDEAIQNYNKQYDTPLAIKLSKSIIYEGPVFYKPREINIAHKGLHQNQVKASDRKQKTVDPQWVEHLRQAYHHYCRSTYATGRNPTFDRIKQETNSMHSSTFVAFCRDFGIQIELDKLMNIFKQASNYKTTLTFESFIEATFKICNRLFPESDQSENEFLVSQKTAQTKYFQTRADRSIQDILRNIPSNMADALKLMGLDSETFFQNKMMRINERSRSHGLNAHQNLVKLKPLSEYKFKVAALNGKNPEQVQEQLIFRRNVKQESKLQQKYQKESEKEKAARRFKYLNKISVSEKRVTTGGYISPPIFNNNNQQNSGPKQSRIINKQTTHVSRLTKNNTRLILVNQEDIEAHKGRRIHTELNTYNNSLQSSMEMKQYQNSKADKESQPSEGGHDSYNMSYLQSYRQKRIQKQGKYQYQGRKFELNQVVKQAKTETDQSTQIIRSPQASNTKLIFSSKISSIYNPGTLKKAKRGKLKTDNAVIEQPSSLGSIIDGIDETEDQYLGKLTSLKKAEPNKKRIVLNF